MNSPILADAAHRLDLAQHVEARLVGAAVRGPHRQATPAAIAANGFVPDDAHMRTVDVDAFCSWSACRMKMRSTARTSTSLTL